MADPPLFTIQKVSNHGASNPIVARIAMQTFELLQVTTLEKNKRDDVAALYAGEILRRMLKLHDAHIRLKTALHETILEVPKVGEQGHNSLPFVIGLRACLRRIPKAALA